MLMLPLALNSYADISVDDDSVTDFCLADQCQLMTNERTRYLFHVAKWKGCFLTLLSISIFHDFLQLEEPDEGCIRPSEDVYCFLAGDPRVNEQTVHPLHHSHSLSSMEE